MLELDRPAGPLPAVRPRALRGAALVGLGTALPEQEVANDDLGLGVDDAWIQQRTGIAARRVLPSTTPLVALAEQAARAALADAATDPADLDLVLVATMSPDDPLPNEAPLLAARLGAERAGALDLSAACTGWISGIALAAAMVETGRARTVLVVGAERMSRFGHVDRRRSGALFGDGAGAVVIGAVAGESRIGPVVLGADGASGPLLALRSDGAGSAAFDMDGQAVFEHATQRMAEVALQALDVAGLQLDDLDVLAFHQANGRITRALVRRLGLTGDPRVVDCIARTGNTVAASLPLALSAARRDGRLRPGARVLLAAFGAGLQWGGTVVTWGASR